MKLENRVAIVTGASSGIGRSIALLLAEEGAKVVVTADKNVAGGEETAAMIIESGGNALFLRADVSKAVDVRNLIGTAEQEYGRLDILVNNAGVMLGLFSIEEYEEAVWDRHYEVNVKGIYLTTKYAVPLMRKAGGGSIVNVTSVLGKIAKPNRAAYASSKAAANMLTRVLAVELAPHIRVNCIMPGLIETAMMHTLSAEERNEIVSHVPLRRLGEPGELAPAVLYLVSEEARFVTGAVLTVDGGDSI
jgi:NAD(P)-dependent dehydrogenase (short-subunit alcohol dehydrogenase family)